LNDQPEGVQATMTEPSLALNIVARCVAANTLDQTQASALLASLPGWQIDEPGPAAKGVHLCQLRSHPAFRKHRGGTLAERENHHPDLEVGYGRVKVNYSTHDVGGLSRNDFICAAKIEALAKFETRRYGRRCLRAAVPRRTGRRERRCSAFRAARRASWSAATG
jgi:4a-hydroxytetrahydrobiopterin dehydratase